jgi:hypothetical protein
MSDLCRCADEVRCKMRAEIERLEAKVKDAFYSGFSYGETNQID